MSVRRALVPLLLVVTGIGLFVGGGGLWAESTLYDSNSFAARVGNQQAIAFRPAFETGIDSALNTDTFRAIFRGAIKILHSDLLNGASGGSGLNLSESVSVVASTLQLSGSDPSQELSKGGFAASFSDVTKKLGDLGRSP